MEKYAPNFTDDELARDLNEVGASIARVGEFMRIAMSEVALEIGGEPFVRAVTEKAGEGPILPNPDALALIKEWDPSGAELVMERTRAIQKEQFKQDWKHLLTRGILPRHK